jgi:hypothetical protein
MSTQAEVTVAITGPADSLQLVYLKEDNLLPSEIEAAKESADNIAAGCNAVSTGPVKTPAELNAEKEALHHLDQHAWPIRKLRLYPAVNAVLRCSYGTIIGQHVVNAVESEIITFSGSDQTTLEHRGDPISITPIGRVYDENANQVNTPSLQYRGRGLLTADRRIWGQFEARYNTQYRVLQLTVVPTGASFEVQVMAKHGDEIADTLVPFELLEFDTGQVAGVDCGGGIDANPEPTNPPPPAGRYQLIAMNHAPEVEKGKTLAVTLILRNINGVQGSGSVTFGLRYTDDSASATFSCDANGQTSVNLNVTCTEVGHFITEGRIIGDFFSTRTGSVQVTDPAEEEPEEWPELEREMSEIDVNGVLIKRIETVTFEKGETGKKVKLIFDNTDVE